MRTTRFFPAGLFIAVLAYSAVSKAEDIDLYSGLSGAAGVPNVLMVMDTGANFSASASPPCTAYASGGAPSLGNTGGGVEQCALVDAIESLPLSTVNIGIMVNNGNNFTNGAAAGVGPCINADGGCLVKPLTLMDAAGKSALITFIKSWKLSGGNSATEFVIKSGGDRTGSNMQEAWAYYKGATGLSGKIYPTNILSSGCQRNFIINIGNSFSNSGGPADTAQSDPNNASVGLQSAQVNATTAQKAKLTDTINFKSTTCGVNQLVAGNAASDWSNNWADEWARYMNTDQSSTLSNNQNITTYTIGVINNGTNTCKPDYPALLTNMAKYGGGKYFQTGDASEVKIALLNILNEVQAVNSVFASSSLPVSVNTQGTFLNQVFIGMFRPDASGAPRWLGNLKQYQFLLDQATQTVSLGDSLGQTAISSAGTGFISPNAVSFWTCGGNPSVRACSPVADPTGGFWVNQPQSAGAAYDLPDGELVEKGGAAQILRLANLNDDYSKAAGTAPTTPAAADGNPRKLYTYCPSGASCAAALTNSANAFTTSNVDIAAAAFGSSITVAVSSIVRTGTTALVTTTGSHGFSTGDSVTISGATQTEYNVTQAITVNSGTTFTITGLPDYPTTPSAGTYAASLQNLVAQTVSTITRNSNAASTADTETATATTAAPHGFTGTPSVTITGASSPYSGTFTIATIPTTTTFTYSVPVYPKATAVNTYKAVLAPRSVNLTSIIKSGGNFTVTATAHGFHNGQTITIAGTSVATYNATWTVSSVAANTFRINASGNPGNATGGTASTSATLMTLTGITRTGTTVAATATATGATASAFSNGNLVNISYFSGAGTTEGAYVATNVAITCSGTCTSFTYPITVTPALAATGSPITVAAAGIPVTIPATNITRSGNTATVTGVANTFTTGQTIDIVTSGAVFPNESAYTGSWPITCPVSCSTAFTFGPVALTPTTPATTATSMTAHRGGGIAIDATALINWVRGQDNFGDEAASPGSPITVRPSIHGDVLHSRPVVLNYGGTTGIVAFYGANDGVFRAINANQTNPLLSTLPVPGSELWGFIPTEFFNQLSRQRTNSPALKLPTTPPGIIPVPQTKDYFADGATGVYQEIDSSGDTTVANIYITMRRGGGIIYALDVCNPAAVNLPCRPTEPKFKWKISNADTGFGELGQTWSRPKVAKLTGYANPVLIFGAGYDTAEDSEPPGVDTQGRGIFIVDADTGALVWSATHGVATACAGNTTQAACTVAGMDYSIPSDVTLIDRDGNGLIERLYVGDTGGNVWRVDLEPTAGNTPNFWQVTRLAALGCATGACATPAVSVATTPRKFFFPPDLVPAGGYDAVLIGSGDREHPLLSSQSSGVTDRMYVLSDPSTGNDSSDQLAPITEATLFNATSDSFDGTVDGFYITMAPGEKVVNAVATIAGQSFFGTNQPATPSANSCDTNLGIARGYRISPFTADGAFSEFEGGGLPPTPVYGVVEIIREGVLDEEGNQVVDQVPFCIGCGGTGSTDAADRGGITGGGAGPLPPECGSISSLEACKAIINVSSDRHRNYWYLDKDQ